VPVVGVYSAQEMDIMPPTSSASKELGVLLSLLIDGSSD
jgi:hypothetical protein